MRVIKEMSSGVPEDCVGSMFSGGLEPPEKQVQIRVEAAELAGSWNADELAAAQTPQRGWVAGTVVSIGKEVSGVEVGERVAAIIEERLALPSAVVESAWVYPIPDDMPFTHAAAIGPDYQIAHIALIQRAGFQRGERVLIGGAVSNIGCAAIQLVNALDGVTIAGVLDKGQMAAALHHGADEIAELPALAGCQREAEKLSPLLSESVDIALDLMGGSVFEAGIEALRCYGRQILTRDAVDEQMSPSWNHKKIIQKNLTIVGVNWRDYFHRYPQRVAAAQQQMYGLYQSGRLIPHISAICSIEQQDLVTFSLREHEPCGKVLLVP